MKVKSLLLSILIFASFSGYSQKDISLSVVDIDPEARKGAHAIKRFHSQELEVQAIDKVILRDHQIWTVFDKQGETDAMLRIYYDEDLDKVKGGNIQGTLYDAKGKKIRKLNSRDIIDLSANDGSSVMTSNRLMGAMLTHHTYPYSVEFTYKKTLSGIYNFSAWVPQPGEKLFVERASLEVSVPKDFNLSYQPVNMDIEPKISGKDGFKTYFWELTNLKPVQTEPLGVPLKDLIPFLYLSSDQVMMGKTAGDLSTWEGFGKLYHDLNKGRSIPSDQLKTKVKEVVQGLDEPKAKAKALYEYMQSSKRYVSIQLGIGGWQSFDAKSVDREGFGDCKALSNYMLTMLKEVGITSYPALIRAEHNPPALDTNIVHDPFNHVILCVPFAEDTVWLECTSSVLPFNYLGRSTGDRFALLATPEGGKLVKTPASKMHRNQQIRFTDVTLNKDGSAEASINTLYTGYQQERIVYIAETQSQKEQEEWVKKNINVGSFELKDFGFTPVSDAEIPSYKSNYSIKARNWAALSGSRIFLRPNQLEPWQLNLPDNEDRNGDIIWSYPFIDKDSIVYHLPEGLFVESMPKEPVEISSEFGAYELKFDTSQPHTLVVIRSLRLLKGQYPAESYKDLRAFFREISRADKLQVVLSDKS